MLLLTVCCSLLLPGVYSEYAGEQWEFANHRKYVCKNGSLTLKSGGVFVKKSALRKALDAIQSIIVPRIGACHITFKSPTKNICDAEMAVFEYSKEAEKPEKQQTSVACRYSYCTESLENIMSVLTARLAPLGDGQIKDDGLRCLRRKLFAFYYDEAPDLEEEALQAKDETMSEEHTAMLKGYRETRQSEVFQKLQLLSPHKKFQERLGDGTKALVLMSSVFFVIAVFLFSFFVVLDAVVRRRASSP